MILLDRTFRLPLFAYHFSLFTFFGRYLSKGSKVLIEGRLQNNIYEKDGVKHYGVDIIVDRVEFAGGKSEKKSDEANGEFDGTPVDDDMPF